MKTIAVGMQKGGVGKTATALNLAFALAERCHPVLLVDLDPQGALTTCLAPETPDHTIYDVLIGKRAIGDVALKVREKITLVPATLDLAGAEVELLNEIGRERILAEKLNNLPFHYCLIDCPPSLGLLTINALTAATSVLIPVQCQYLAFKGMQQLLGTVEKVKSRSNPSLTVAGLLPTLYDARTAHSREVLALLKENYPDQVLEPAIKARTAVADAALAHQSVLEYDPKSDVAEAYRKIAEVLDSGN